MGNSLSDFKDGKFSKYRDRQRSEITGTGGQSSWFGDYAYKPPAMTHSAGFAERVVDITHPNFYPHLRRLQSLKRTDPEYKRLRDLDIGGPFCKEGVSLTMPYSIKAVRGSGNTQQGYEGLVFPSSSYYNTMLSIKKGSFPTIPVDLGIDKASLTALGSTAIAKSIPDIPDFSLFRFVAELREGLPKVPLKILAKEKKVRAIGGEYLNYQFGIAPLVSDLQDFLEAVQHPKFRAAVQNNLDREFRIRKLIDKDSKESVIAMTTSEGAVSPSASPNGQIKTSSKMKIWSSCSFAYHQLTELDRLLADLDRMTGGLGVIPTAIDIWNLVPWSWLVDWFTNFNHVMTNLSYLGRDGLYLKRGYLMASYEKVVETRRFGTTYNTSWDVTGTLKYERKYRIPASPFGFGYTWKDFNAFQLSILGALGVNRLKF